MKKIKKELKAWGSALLFAVLVVTPLRWLVAEPYKIPTPSMEGSLLVGDFLVVSKYHYGARTAKTMLQVPLTFQKIWLTEIPSYLDWVQAPFLRGPGISKIKRNDPVVFNFTGELENPVDMRTYYIKRCVAIAGDTIQIKDKQLFLNSKKQNNPKNLQSSFFIKTQSKIKERIFKRHNISEIIQNDQGYIVHATKENAFTFKRYDFVEEVTELDVDVPNSGTYPQSSNIKWTADNFGPLYVPKMGDEIQINMETLELYGDLIKEYDLNENVEIRNNLLFVDDKVKNTYRFKQDYYFMMGDNRHNSLDSRYWGFVPMDHVVGKAIFTWFSIDENQSLFNSIRWNRIFRPIE